MHRYRFTLAVLLTALACAQLTLMTDGVVEAQSAANAFFSFERNAAISNQPAEAIAFAARQFGQGDDITVLTLTFAGSEVTLA
jgi:phosphoserine phosphatase RsbU/P